jgi:ribonuclease HII
MDFSRESEAYLNGHGPVAGVDEAGRGPLAGPVVAAAVILDPRNIPPGLDDSKKLSEAKREALYDLITQHAQVGIASVPPNIIDAINIRQASLRAMTLALTALPLRPVFVLVDGKDCPALPVGMVPCAVIDGDALSLSIAAASIIAKVTRDRMMASLDRVQPQYGFAGHKGYGAASHREALVRHGVGPDHRRTFGTVRRLIEEAEG